MIHRQVRNERSQDGNSIWKTLDHFNNTYYSGLDARVFANDVLISEIIELQYTLQEAVAPLFGYHDYIFSTVMHGVRRVNGSFKINFVREAYLFELLLALEKKPGTGINNQPTSMRTLDAFQIAAEGNADLETLLGLAIADGQTPTDSSGRPRFDTSLLNLVADDFSSAIWDSPSNVPPNSNSTVRTTVGELLEKTRSDRPRFELQSRPNLNIIFGSTTPEKISTLKQEGVSGSLDSRSLIPVETQSRILGVCLTGVNRVIDDSGRPLQEDYMFIGRDII